MSIENQLEHRQSTVPFKNKTDYFSNLAMHLYSMAKLDIKFGKLTRRSSENEKLSEKDPDNWSNVTEHCLVEAAAINELGKALGLNQEEINQLTKAAAVHDWNKRIEVCLDQFTADEINSAQQAFEEMGVLDDLIEATKAEYVKRFLIDKTATPLQKLLHYIDVVTDETDIVPYEDRLEKAIPRALHLKNDTKWGKIVEPVMGAGKDYFDALKEVSRQEQQEIFKKLVERGYTLSADTEVPAFIKALIETNYK